VAKSLVSGKESRASRTEGHESGGKSLLDKISISEICVRECPETGCVSAETGANLGELAHSGAGLKSGGVRSPNPDGSFTPTCGHHRGMEETLPSDSGCDAVP
jgi:hypothetical protein